MTIQSFGQAGVQVSHQDQKPAPGSLGSTGNLRFKPKQGGTPRISRFGVLRARIGNLLARLKIAVSWVSKEIRAQRKAVIQSRANSLRIASLLGALTAPAGDGKARIVQGLAQICKQINKNEDLKGGNLDSMLGGREALSIHLRQLSDMDLHALRDGVLSHLDFREEILTEMGALREQAGKILNQIKTAADQRIAKDVVQAPLSELDKLLSPLPVDGQIPPVDGQALAEKLIIFSNSLAMVQTTNKSFELSENNGVVVELNAGEDTPQSLSMLESYLGSLPQDQVQELLAAFNSSKLEEAEQALAQLTSEPEQKQALAMLESIRRAFEREIIERSRESWVNVELALYQAEYSGSRAAVSEALCKLNAVLVETEQTYGWLPKAMVEETKMWFKDGLEKFRDVKNNPNGPLNEASLRRLDDVSVGNLRHATRLHSLGLQLEAPTDAGQRRIQALGWQTVESMKNVFQAMTGESLDITVFLQKVRDLSGVEVLRVRELKALGFDDSDVNEFEEFGRLALEELQRAVDPEQLGAVQSHMFQLKRQAEEFARIEKALVEVVSLADYKVGGQQIMAQLGATKQLLRSMSGALEEAFNLQNADSVPSESASLDASTLPDAFYRVLQTQYGVAYDPQEGKAAVLLTDSVRALMVPRLEIIPNANSSGHIPKKITLPVNGIEKTFTVSHQFFNDAIDRPDTYFSVRGVAPDGQLLSFTWPYFTKMDTDDRIRCLGSAMNVFDQIAGPALEALTRIVNQQIYPGILEGEILMGQNAPFRLADGTICSAFGAQKLHFEFISNVDDSFSLAIRARANAGLGEIRQADGKKLFVRYDSETSWTETEYTLKVSSDGLRIEVEGLPQFRYHLDVVKDSEVDKLNAE